MCRVALCSDSKLEFTLDGAPFRCQAWARPTGGADVEKSCLRETDQPAGGALAVSWGQQGSTAPDRGWEQGGEPRRSKCRT